MRARPSRRILLSAALVCTAAAALGGCSTGGAPSDTNPSTTTGSQTTPAGVRSAASAALKLWDSFPATASPRPIVLLGGTLVAPAGGFTTGVAKLAFVQGIFRLEAPLPTAPSHSHGYAIVPVGDVLKTSTVAGPALAITRVTLGTASFRTDRGLRELPAWKLYFDGGNGPAAVLALAPKELFTPPKILKGPDSLVAAIGAAAASTDGTTVTVGFTGGTAGSQPCDVNYSSVLATSPQAVAISVIPHPVATGPNTACPAIAQERQLRVHLGEPLGGRVLINGANGAAIPVAIGASSPSVATSPARPTTTPGASTTTATTPAGTTT